MAQAGIGGGILPATKETGRMEYGAQIGGAFVAVLWRDDLNRYDVTITTLQHRARLSVGRALDHRAVDALDTFREVAQAAVNLAAYDPDDQSETAQAIADATEGSMTDSGRYVFGHEVQP